MIVGSNPRREAAVLNARIRKRWGRGGLSVAVIGEQADLTYPFEYLGAGPDTLAKFTSKSSFMETLSKAEHPMIIVGRGALDRPEGAAILAAAAGIARDANIIKDGWNGFCVLHDTASMVGALDLGFVPGEGGNQPLDTSSVDVLFNLGADESDISAGPFVIYVGTHGDRGAMRADVILPSAAYTEKSATYVNTEGRVQMSNRAIFPVGDAKEDWAIFRALSEVLGVKLPFDTLQQLRSALYAEYPHFAQVDTIAAGTDDGVASLAQIGGALGGAPFAATVSDFYLTNPVARASRIMAECSDLASGRTALAAE